MSYKCCATAAIVFLYLKHSKWFTAAFQVHRWEHLLKYSYFRYEFACFDYVNKLITANFTANRYNKIILLEKKKQLGWEEFYIFRENNIISLLWLFYTIELLEVLISMPILPCNGISNSKKFCDENFIDQPTHAESERERESLRIWENLTSIYNGIK